MKYHIIWSRKFKKDYKLAMKRGLDIELLDKAILILAETGTLPEQYKDHALVGNYEGFRECHIQPDWLLIYKIVDDKLALALTRTGSHSDLF